MDSDRLSGCAHNGKEFTPIDIPEHLSRPEGAPKDWLDYLWSQLLKAFVASVNGLESDVPTFYDGLKCQEIIDAVLSRFCAGTDVAPGSRAHGRVAGGERGK